MNLTNPPAMVIDKRRLKKMCV